MYEAYRVIISSRVFQGCFDMVDRRSVQHEKAVVESFGAVDVERRVLGVEYVDVFLREPVPDV